ncbi:MAG: acyl-CoA desaturase, partial [Bacteroidota bacterium]
MHPKVKFARPDTSQFFNTLRKKVNTYFAENQLSKNGDARMVAKTLVMLLLYFGPYFLLLSGWVPAVIAWLLCMVMGLGLAGIGFSIGHDANHGAYSHNSQLNNFLGFSFNLIGGSSFTWKVQHNLLHHTYTNIYQLDEDIHDKPILRLSPYGKLTWIHRYQHWYALGLYSLSTISWILVKDFAQLVNYNRSGLTIKSGHRPLPQLLILIFSKILYFAYMLVIPLLFFPYQWWQILLGFLLMHMVAGFVLTLVFQCAHVVEGPSHHQPTESGSMENTWAIHQLRTTANFARHNRLLSWFVGGL